MLHHLKSLLATIAITMLRTSPDKHHLGLLVHVALHVVFHILLHLQLLEHLIVVLYLLDALLAKESVSW